MGEFEVHCRVVAIDPRRADAMHKTRRRGHSWLLSKLKGFFIIIILFYMEVEKINK
jgi:hypothetical protein